jgi:hypothetical protein
VEVAARANDIMLEVSDAGGNEPRFFKFNERAIEELYDDEAEL